MKTMIISLAVLLLAGCGEYFSNVPERELGIWIENVDFPHEKGRRYSIRRIVTTEDLDRVGKINGVYKVWTSYYDPYSVTLNYGVAFSFGEIDDAVIKVLLEGNHENNSSVTN